MNKIRSHLHCIYFKKGIHISIQSGQATSAPDQHHLSHHFA
jgi:hypothetical protein